MTVPVTPGPTARVWVVRALAVVLAVVLAGCASSSGESAGGSSDGEGHNDADTAFATAMVPHHAQAIAMARLATDRAGSGSIKQLAGQVAAEQMPEIVQMRGLLAEWGAPPVPTAAAMPGMNGADDTADMPDMGHGMMTDQQMRDLAAASGPAFDRMFLRLMVKHDGGGVEMARTEMSDGENSDAQLLAQNISDSQQAQTTYMLQMLASG